VDNDARGRLGRHARIARAVASDQPTSARVSGRAPAHPGRAHRPRRRGRTAGRGGTHQVGRRGDPSPDRREQGMSDPKETSTTVEVVYRGIFQNTLAQRICRSIVLAARKRGHTGTAFARYGDSPERNGVPAKQFAVVAVNDLELEASMAKYEPAVVDVSIAVDDTLVKGVESWAWYGRQPIWKPVKKDGFLLVTSDNSPDEVLAQTDKAERPYTLVTVPGGASFAGLWVFKDDHTDYRVLGALAKIAPDWVRLDDVMALIKEQTKDECSEVTPEGHYEVVYQACIGCGICAQVCPVTDCIVMVDELRFEDNEDKWQFWKKDHDGYNKWFEAKSGVSADPKVRTPAARQEGSSNANPSANPTSASGGGE